MEMQLHVALLIYLGGVEDSRAKTIATLGWDSPAPVKVAALEAMILSEEWDEFAQLPRMLRKVMKDRNLVAHAPRVASEPGDTVKLLRMRRGEMGLREVSLPEILDRLQDVLETVDAVVMRAARLRGLTP